jgi:Sodium/calcium exchanger protein
MTGSIAVAAFVAGALVSLATGWLLVSRLERVGERLGLSEALLGIVAALAADAPEVTAAVSAMAGGEQRLGAGVVIGSNVFNLAALLGLGAVVAGRIGLHRKVVLLGGTAAMGVAGVCLAVVLGLVPPAVGCLLGPFVVALYAVALGISGQGLARLRLPRPWITWLRSAVAEEEAELESALRPAPGPGHTAGPPIACRGPPRPSRWRSAHRYPRRRPAARRRPDPRRHHPAPQLPGMALRPRVRMEAPRHHPPGLAHHPRLRPGIPVQPGSSEPAAAGPRPRNRP